MSGKTPFGSESSLSLLFSKQLEFQNKISGIEKPTDDTKWFSYHIQAIVEEIGELLKADKRWKTHRNAYYDRENKLEEWSDVFISLINIALYSGFEDYEVFQAILKKIQENTEKLQKGENCSDNNSGGNRQGR